MEMGYHVNHNYDLKMPVFVLILLVFPLCALCDLCGFIRFQVVELPLRTNL
jgi:hypothetical protein